MAGVQWVYPATFAEAATLLERVQDAGEAALKLCCSRLEAAARNDPHVQRHVADVKVSPPYTAHVALCVAPTLLSEGPIFPSCRGVAACAGVCTDLLPTHAKGYAKARQRIGSGKIV